MDKMELFRTTYAGIQEAKRMYDMAEDERVKEAAKTTYALAIKNVSELKGAEAMLWKAYAEARETGNDYVDFNDITSDKYIAGLVQAMKEFGITRFTFSSTWSSAVEVAWEFQKEGCRLDGLVEINSHYKEFLSGEYEKAHGYLFSVM